MAATYLQQGPVDHRPEAAQDDLIHALLGVHGPVPLVGDVDHAPLSPLHQGVLHVGSHGYVPLPPLLHRLREALGSPLLQQLLVPLRALVPHLLVPLALCAPSLQGSIQPGGTAVHLCRQAHHLVQAVHLARALAGQHLELGHVSPVQPIHLGGLRVRQPVSTSAAARAGTQPRSVTHAVSACLAADRQGADVPLAQADRPQGMPAMVVGDVICYAGHHVEGQGVQGRGHGDVRTEMLGTRSTPAVKLPTWQLTAPP